METEKILEFGVKIFGYCCNGLWEEYDRYLHGKEHNREVVEALRRETRFPLCSSSVFTKNCPLPVPFYVIVEDEKIINKKQLEKRVQKTFGVNDNTAFSVVFYTIARSRYLYKMMKIGLGRRNYWLGGLELRYRLTHASFQPLFFPEPDPEAKFIFIHPEDKEYLLIIYDKINARDPREILLESV